MFTIKNELLSPGQVASGLYGNATLIERKLALACYDNLDEHGKAIVEDRRMAFYAPDNPKRG